MVRPASFLVSLCLCAMLTACTHASSPLPKDTPAPTIAPTAHSIDTAVERIASNTTTPLWPNFDPRTVPLAIFDGTTTWLFRHPSPPAPFVRDPATNAWRMPGRHDAISANTSTDLGGVQTGTLMLDATKARSTDAWAAIAIHEAFHVFQRTHHKTWSGNEADLFTYPVDAPALLAQRRLETRALADALASTDRDTAACHARAAIAARNARFAAMEPAYPAYERGTELNEGLAAYVQLRAEGKSHVDIPADEFGPEQVRQRAYVAGPALALLLDRFAPGWPATFEANDAQTLDGALAKAVGAGRTCAFPDADVAAANAAQDIAALQQARVRKLEAFAATPGWRVIVEAPKDKPLWPQGFDPVNVERLDGTRVLHTRYLKLGNDSGSIEVLGAEAVTSGVGPHPLFQGVWWVEVLGEKVNVEQTDDRVHLSREGLRATFANAHVEILGRKILIVLR
jgi:hypothetical protein